MVNGARVTLQEEEWDRQAVRAVVGNPSRRRHSMPAALGGAGLILVDGGALGHLSVSVHGLAANVNRDKLGNQWVHDDNPEKMPKVADVNLPHAWMGQPLSLHKQADPTEPFRPAYPLSVLRLTSSSSRVAPSSSSAMIGEGFIAPTHYYLNESGTAEQ